MEPFSWPARRLVATVVVVTLIGAGVLIWRKTQPQPVYLDQYQARSAQFPWMVATLTDDGESFNCGGVLIAAQWVLSAKHCYAEDSPSDVQVRIGSSDWSTGGEVRQLADIELHPDPAQDLALLQLSEPAEGPVVSIGAPPAAYQKGTPAVTLGWGVARQRESEDYRSNLRWSEQVITGDNNCGGGAEGVFCAGRPDHLGSGTCDGDSGGPLLWSAEGFDPAGFARGEVYVLGTLRGLNNSSCYLPGHNDDWQSVDYGLEWIQSVVRSTPDLAAPSPTRS